MVTNTNTAYPDYIFEVRLPNSHRSVNEYVHKGKNYIEGRKGSDYTLFFRNRTNRRVLVVMSVDGLSIMNGKTAGVNSGGYVVEPYRDIDVPGWKLDNNKAAKFTFRPQGDRQDPTYVEALKADGIDVDSGNQGVIGCLVFPEKPYEKPLYERYSTGYVGGHPGPYRSFGLSDVSGQSSGQLSGYVDNSRNAVDAVVKSAFRSYSSDSVRGLTGSGGITPNINTFASNAMSPPSEPLGTGMGDATSFRTQTVEFVRESSTFPAWQTFFVYDTIRGLKARGVVVDTLDESITNAFPASPNLSGDGCYVPKPRRSYVRG